MTVLSGATICTRLPELFPAHDADEQKVKAAKYYLTLGEIFLILPNGEKHGPDRPRSKPITIWPGHTAYVSTAEHLVMPDDLVGIIGPRFSSAEMGMLFFGGMVIDPGWGVDGRPLGQPLSFNIANVGRSPLALRPGEDAIASLAFMELDKAADQDSSYDNRRDTSYDKAIRMREELFASKKRRPSGALGLVEDLGDIREEVDKMKASLKTVVLFGVVVLAATLFAAVIAAILSFSNDSGAAEISSESWESIGWALGSVAFGTLAVITFFYAVVNLGGKLIGHLRSRGIE
jgi:deoxycytidine triphosphate deaminase